MPLSATTAPPINRQFALPVGFQLAMLLPSKSVTHFPFAGALAWPCKYSGVKAQSAASKRKKGTASAVPMRFLTSTFIAGFTCDLPRGRKRPPNRLRGSLYHSSGASDAGVLLRDVPDVEELAVAGGGHGAFGFAGGAIQRRAHFRLALGQLAEGYFQSGALFQPVQILEDRGNDLLVFSVPALRNIALDHRLEMHGNFFGLAHSHVRPPRRSAYTQ